jgi:hypothetical protein
MRDIEIAFWCVLCIVLVLASDWLMMAHVHECSSFADNATTSRCEGQRWRRD